MVDYDSREARLHSTKLLILRQNYRKYRLIRKIFIYDVAYNIFTQLSYCVTPEIINSHNNFTWQLLRDELRYLRTIIVSGDLSSILDYKIGTDIVDKFWITHNYGGLGIVSKEGSNYYFRPRNSLVSIAANYKQIKFSKRVKIIM